MIKALLVIALCLQVLVACSVDAVTRGLYEGAKTRNNLQQRPSDSLGKPVTPDYAEYQRMRREQNQ